MTASTPMIPCPIHTKYRHPELCRHCRADNRKDAPPLAPSLVRKRRSGSISWQLKLFFGGRDAVSGTPTDADLKRSKRRSRARTTLAIAAAIILALLMLLLPPRQADAGRVCVQRVLVTIPGEWPTYTRREVRCVRWAHTHDGPRYYAPPRHREHDEDGGWERRDPRYERGVQCNAETIRVVGEAHLTKEGALNSAIRQWQSTVRYDWGEKRMDIENARDYRWRCDRASTNESTLGRVGDAVTGGSAYQRRCVVIARPCQMPVARGDEDKR